MVFWLVRGSPVALLGAGRFPRHGRAYRKADNVIVAPRVAGYVAEVSPPTTANESGD